MIRSLIGMALAAMLGAVGCSNSSDPGPVTGKTAYLSCEVDAAKCPGAALCKGDGGKADCVVLPSTCSGKLTCECLAATVCAGKACSEDASGTALSCKAAEPGTCTPGDSFPTPDGCNTCTCPPSGKKTDAACTAKACVEPDACTAGETFPASDGCNTCTCPASGKKSEAACTEMACVDPDVCKEGESWLAADGCNHCTCEASGKKADALCTMTPCIDPDACTPGESFKADDGCNTCTCPASGKKKEAPCTEMACVWAPCEGLKCGDSCSPCKPGPDCVPPPAIYVCDGAGQCTVGQVGVCPTATVECAAGGPVVFPEPLDSCKADADCVVVLHQINCCGTQVAWGIAAAGAEAFKVAEATCESQYPACGCAQFETKADDDTTGWTLTDFEAVCAGGQCKSQGAKGCHAGKECGDNGAYCLSPGASQGCGMCMDPEQGFVTTCADDAACQKTDPNSICLQSTIADCLCSSAMLCKPGCTSNASCAEGEVCQDDKHCAAAPCSEATPCPANFSCTGGACARMTCTANAECAGYCVNGQCYATAGMCTFPVP